MKKIIPIRIRLKTSILKKKVRLKNPMLKKDLRKSRALPRLKNAHLKQIDERLVLEFTYLTFIELTLPSMPYFSLGKEN